MTRYIANRVVQIVFTFFVFLTLIYFLLLSQPGDISRQFIGDPKMTAEMREAIRKQMGLDRPWYEQYLNYMRNFVVGNLGISYSNFPRPVIEIIAERAPRTIILFLTSTIISFTLGFTLGKILAWRRGSLTEYAATFGGVTLYTVFTPWFGLMMIWFFAFTLGLFPIGKFIDPVLWRTAPMSANDVFLTMIQTAVIALSVILIAYFISRRMERRYRGWVVWGGVVLALGGVLVAWAGNPTVRYALDILHHLILPIMTLTAISFAGSMLLTRNSMLETIREDYIMAARAKGLPDKVIRDKHAARNAMLPVVTSFVFALAFALDGGVITETVFSWPGMGLTLLDAVTEEDIPLAIGALVFTGILALTAHLVADVLYAFLDPRIRYSES